MRTGTKRALRTASTVIAATLFVAAPVPTAAAPPPDDPSPYRIDHVEFPSDLVDTSTPGGTLMGDRDVPELFVFLPEGYDDNPDADYPVLWLLHGANTAPAHNAEWIQEMAPDFPGIVVMPDGGRFGMYTDWWNGGERGGPAWTTYHLSEVMDHVESTYRIRPGRQWHALLGISMGGQGVLRYAALRPGYFGSVAALSAAMPDIQGPLFQAGFSVILAAGGAPTAASYSAIWSTPTSQYAEGHSPQALLDNLEHTRVFLSTGNGVNCPSDPVGTPDGFLLDSGTEAFIAVQQSLFELSLRGAGIDVDAHTTCGRHTFGVWDRAWDVAERWGFFGTADADVDDWTYRTIQDRGVMWGITYDFAEPPTSVVRFSQDGDRLSGSGAGTVTLTDADGCDAELTLPFDLATGEVWTCGAADVSGVDGAPPPSATPDAPVDDLAEMHDAPTPRTPAGVTPTLPATGSDGSAMPAVALLGVAAALRLAVRSRR